MQRMIMALGAVAIGAMVTLLLAELVVRTLLPQWSDQWKMWRIDPVYARGLKPSVEAAVVHGHSKEFAFAFSTNAQGLRMDTDLDPGRRADQGASRDAAVTPIGPGSSGLLDRSVPSA